MGEIDVWTWRALGLTLTVLGLAASLVVARRRDLASGLRGAAWSLLPLAAALTGTLQLAADVAGFVAGWAVRLVFSPVVWSGIALASVSAALFTVSGFLRRRSPGRAAGRVEGQQGLSATSSRSPATGPGADPEDMQDIEAILRKHGIS